MSTQTFRSFSLVALLTLILALAVGCGGGSNLSRSDSRAADAPPPAAAPAPAQGRAESGAAATGSGQQQQQLDRKIIRTANLTLRVNSIQDVLRQVGDLADRSGGYVVSSEQRGPEENPTGRISIRVPSDRFTATVDQIRGMGIKVEQDAVSSQDVTEEFVDQDARLRALRATESTYLELLKQAKSVEDVIKVQQSLTSVREQIEKTEGRLNYLRTSTETSVINVELRTAAAARPVVGGIELGEQFGLAFRALMATVYALVAIAIWLIVFAPFWGAFLVGIWYFARRQTRRPPAGVTPAGTEATGA